MLRVENKRHSPRVRLKTPLHYQLRGRQEFENVVSDDISEGGLSFVGNRFIPSSTLLMLEINVLSRILRPIGRIAWSSPIPHSDRNRLGVEFVEVAPNEKHYLSDYVKMQLGQL